MHAPACRPRTTRPFRLLSRNRPILLLIGFCIAGLSVFSGPLQASTRHRHRPPPHAAPAPDAPEAVHHAYRCPGPQGQVIYSQWPCDGGASLNKLDDPRTRAQQKDGADQIERDQALSRRMARDRQHLNKQAEGQTPISLGSSAGQHAREAQKAKAVPTTDPHAPVKLQRCRPPRCFTARVPKDKKASSS